jgi:hypothetical protein
MKRPHTAVIFFILNAQLPFWFFDILLFRIQNLFPPDVSDTTTNKHSSHVEPFNCSNKPKLAHHYRDHEA